MFPQIFQLQLSYSCDIYIVRENHTLCLNIYSLVVINTVQCPYMQLQYSLSSIHTCQTGMYILIISSSYHYTYLEYPVNDNNTAMGKYGNLIFTLHIYKCFRIATCTSPNKVTLQFVLYET
jgi:hypothetical protein